MAAKFLQLTLTPGVCRTQERAYGRHAVAPKDTPDDALTDEEAAFIAARDSFYLATVNEHGWPYLQHRGGPPGFLHVRDPHTLAFADLRGNRQLQSTGNLAGSDRVALFLMDYPRRERLKILGHARVVERAADPKLLEAVTPPGLERAAERAMVIRVAGFDWNCPQYITPRFTEAEIGAALRPLQQRIAELEAQLAELRNQPSLTHKPESSMP